MKRTLNRLVCDVVVCDVLLPSTRFPAPDSQHQIPSTRFPAPDSQHQIPSPGRVNGEGDLSKQEASDLIEYLKSL
jgi:hypothetical protein